MNKNSSTNPASGNFRVNFLRIVPLLFNRVTAIVAIVAMLFVLNVSLSAAQNGVTPQAQNKTITISGSFTILHSDPQPGTGGKKQISYVLTDSAGKNYLLELDPRLSSRVQILRGKQVKVTGIVTPTPNSGNQSPTLQVQTLQEGDIVPGSKPSPDATGNRPFISLMCKYSGAADQPRTTDFFLTQLNNTKPGFNNYIREMSYNATNMDNSNASGWYTLPKDKAQYDGLGFPDGVYQIARDCAAIAEAGQNGIAPIGNFPTYFGINIMLNQGVTPNNVALGGQTPNLALGGETRNWPTTWMPYSEGSTFGWLKHGVLAHEISHAFGAPHSGNTTGYEYGSSWDVVGNPGANCEVTGGTDPNYGCLGQGIMTYNKDVMGFMPASRKITYNRANGAQTITLDNLAQPASANSTLMVVIPSLANPATRFYTIEARYRLGYDTKLPGDGLIIHDVDTTRGSNNPNAPIPWLVAPPGAQPDGRNPNPPAAQGVGDLNARWQAGSTFTDAANEFSVSIAAGATNTFVITITPAGQPVGTALTVTAPIDDSTGQPNTLSAALTTAAGDPGVGIIQFNLPNAANNTVSITGNLPPVRAGLTIRGRPDCATAGPNITLDGSDTATRLNVNAGSINLTAITLKNFVGPQILFDRSIGGAGPNKFRCAVISKVQLN